MSFWRTLFVLYIHPPEPKQYALLFPLFDPDFKCCHVVLDKLHNLPLCLGPSSFLKWKYYSLFPVSVFRLEWLSRVSCSGSLTIRFSGWYICKVLWFFCNVCLQVFCNQLQRWFGMTVPVVCQVCLQVQQQPFHTEDAPGTDRSKSEPNQQKLGKGSSCTVVLLYCAWIW